MNYYNKSLNDFKTNFLLYVPLTIILQSCIGSIAAMYILMNSTVESFNFFQLTLCVMLSMGYNAVILAQLKGKLIFNVLIVSLLVNCLLIAINVIQLS